MVLKLYVSRTSGNVVIKVQQEHIKRVFDCKKIPYEEVDVADPCKVKDKEFMQSTVRQRVTSTSTSPSSEGHVITVLPPQLFDGNNYKGDYEGFFEAVETESMYRYLGLEVPHTEVEYHRMLEQQQKQQQQHEQQQQNERHEQQQQE